MVAELDVPLHLMEAVDHVNEAQKQVLFRKIHKHYGSGLRAEDAGHLGPGVQAAHRRHPRSARPWR